jgi:hypothetical protein
MEAPELWEKLLIGILVVGVIFLFRPGIKATWERSQQAKKDWAGFLLPIGAMVLFIILLIYMARNN